MVTESGYLCGACGSTQFLNSKPSVGGIIVENEKVLLVSDDTQAGWDVPGGFLLLGEHPVKGLQRELREELSIEIRVDSFLDAVIDPYGKDGEYSLNLLYEARIISGKPRPSGEIAQCAWFDLRNSPPLRYRGNNDVIMRLRNRLDGQHAKNHQA
jgi:ADP-ribose pyrophosphatase YjhB (NUDIX family)